MKIWKLLIVFACCAGLTQAVWGQDRAAGGTLAHQRARLLQAAPESQTAEADELAPAAAPLTGTLKFVFTITVKSTNLGSDQIACTADASVSDGTFPAGNVFDETAAVAATRNGSTATCTVQIPYSWPLTTPTTDMVSLDVSVSAPSVFTINSALPIRSHTRTLNSIKVPLNGATTTTNVAITI